MQAALMMMIINTVQSGKVNVPLWDTATQNYPNNQSFLADFIVNLVSNGCKNLNKYVFLFFMITYFIQLLIICIDNKFLISPLGYLFTHKIRITSINTFEIS